MFPNLVYSNNKSTNKSDTNNTSTTDTTNNNKNKKYTNSKLENECLIASLNARAVLFSSLISNNSNNNNNNSGTTSSIGSLMPISNMFNNNSANPFSMVANEYFTSYLQALNQSIQFEKVI
jgi:hypothetical protein